MKDVLGNNPTRRKFIMMAVVSDIISEGRIIDFRKKYDGENADRITTAAPLTIANSSEFGGEYYGDVSIKVTPKNNRAYILNYAYTKKRTALPYNRPGPRILISYAIQEQNRLLILVVYSKNYKNRIYISEWTPYDRKHLRK